MGNATFVSNRPALACIILVAGLALALSGCQSGPALPNRISEVTVASPGGETVATLAPDANGRLTCAVSFDGNVVLNPSPLGLALKSGLQLGTKVHIVSTKPQRADETYAWRFGKSSRIKNDYKGQLVTLEDDAGRALIVEMRCFDDGFAFRYEIPGSGEELKITRELTSFRFAGNPEFWAADLKTFTSDYEASYQRGRLDDMPGSWLVGLPLLLHVDGSAWVGLTEADLNNYASLYLKHGPDHGLDTELSPRVGDVGVCVSARTPIVTPWRVLMLGRDAGRLMESNVVLNLNPPSAEDMSWVKPGLCSSSWWSGHAVKGTGWKGAMDDRTMEYYIDFAGEYHVPYVLVGPGWYGPDADGAGDITKSIAAINIPMLVSYARDRGVGLILGVNSKGVAQEMDEAFTLYETWGIKGVEVDGMNRDDQQMVAFYHHVAADAASHHLVVSFHGAYKPTGLRRTYPNILTRDAVLGLAADRLSTRVGPEHDVLVPFTRVLAGPMDYTLGGFDNVTRSDFQPRAYQPEVMGTRAHQLALYVIFESPLQMLCDSPGNYRGQVGTKFITSVPTTWDETRVVDEKIGQYLVVARRKGTDWYLGAITNSEARVLNVPLNFLGTRSYTAKIYADGSAASTKPSDVSVAEVPVRDNRSMTLLLVAGGGQAIHFSPVKQSSSP